MMSDIRRIVVHKNLPLLLKVCFSAILVWTIFYLFEPAPIIEQIKKTSPLLYFIVILGHFILMAVKALRWKILLGSLQIRCSYHEALKAYTTAFSFGTFTPGQLGDMAKVMLIDGARGKRKIALVASFVDRLWDLVGLCFVSLGCISILFWTSLDIFHISIYGILFCITCSGLFFVVYPMVQKFIQKRFGADINLAFINWPFSLVLTVLAVTVQLLRWLILSSAMGLPPITSTAIATIGTLVALVPVSFGGLGTREGTMAALFSFCGLNPVSGVGFSLLMFGSYLFGAGVGAVLFFTYKTTLTPMPGK